MLVGVYGLVACAVPRATADPTPGRVRFILEPGVHVGAPLKKQRFRESRIRYNVDVGLDFARASGRALGITLQSSFAGSDSRFAIRPRYTWGGGDPLSYTLSAGYIFHTVEESNEPEDADVSDSGFVGGGSVNIGDLALQLDLSVVEVGESFGYDGGTEASLFGGVAYRGTTGLKIGAFAGGIVLVLMIIYAASNS
jgi:hypothetical protein